MFCSKWLVFSEPVTYCWLLWFRCIWEDASLFYELQVNENGVFSFGDPWQFSHPNRYPTTNPATRLRHVIGPFWSDNDIRREGTIRYVTIESTSPTGSIRIMNETADYVNDRLVVGDEVFQPTWMIIAQWDRVHPHPHGEPHEGASEEYLNRVSSYDYNGKPAL